MTEPTVEIALREWSKKTIPGVVLSKDGKRLAESLSKRGGPRIELVELVAGLQVKTTSWVGVVQLDGIRITVEPKLAGEHLELAKLVDWTSGLDSLRSVQSAAPLDFEGDDLFDLLARLLIGETEHLLRGGLRSDYVEKQEALPVLRGRLDIDRQISRRRGRLELLECRFDDRSTDIVDNQLLLAALTRCTPRIRNQQLKRRANRTRMMLSELCSQTGGDLAERPIRYDRMNRHYVTGHHWARTILRGSRGLESFFRAGSGPCFGFFLDMNQLFEQFVERAFTKILADSRFGLEFQRRSGSVLRRSDGRSYKSLIPDTLLKIPEESITLPIDAKYKRYSEKDVNPGDIAQVFLYAFGLWDPAAGPIRRAMIVHPSETGSVESQQIHVRDPTQRHLAEIAILGIPVAGLLAELDGSTSSCPLSDALRERILTHACAPSNASTGTKPEDPPLNILGGF